MAKRENKAAYTHVFHYRLDLNSKRITVMVLALLVEAFGLFQYFAIGGYMPAWFLFFAVVMLALYILSIPRHIHVDEEALEIHCLLESSYIHYADLKSVRCMEPGEMKFAFPLLGSYGFFGYYGYYFNLREWSTIKVYASQWGNFVEIEDIYEQKYVVSCDEPHRLIAAIHDRQGHHQHIKPAHRKHEKSHSLDT